jgi:Putative DNA-binding domain
MRDFSARRAMPTLPEIQVGFAAAILRDDASDVVRAIVPDGLTPAARVQLYRNHVLSSLTEALATTYPVVCRLVDRRFFGFAADAYIRRHPPAGPCLFEYGATFPGFLGTFPPCADYPYLADVAYLEWAMNTVLHADETLPIPRTALGDVRSEDIGPVVLRIDPSAAWLRSDWPIDRIWAANQPGADPHATVDLGAGEVGLEIRRRDDAVALRRLDAPTFAFRAALTDSLTLEAALARALGQDPGFDLSGALRAILDEALVVGFTLERGSEGGRRA